MAKRTRVELSSEQEAELHQVRDRHPKPYMRERAAAVLKVAAGESVHHVAQAGLLRRREPETVSRWIAQYQSGGIGGWEIKPGRGRKPGFFPSADGGGTRGSTALPVPDAL